MPDPFLARPRRRKGVSEVLGALLLIVVVVAAVASLSVFLAQAQTNAQNRESYITSVQNENLQFAAAQFTPSSPSVLWELDQPGTPVMRYYVTMVTSTSVTLNLQNTSVFTPYTLMGGTFSSIAAGVTASVGVGIITIGGAGYTFEPATWSNVILTVRNENTAQSGIYQVKVGDLWMSAWKQVNQTGATITDLGPEISPLVVPAKGTESILIDFSAIQGDSFPKDASLSFEILSSAGNLFSTTYTPPTAVPTAGSASENYLVTTRDIVTFDGSHSYQGSSAIQGYFWQIDVPKLTVSDTVAAVPPAPTNTFTTTNTYVANALAGDTITFASGSPAVPHTDTIVSNTANVITLAMPLTMDPNVLDGFTVSTCSVSSFASPALYDTTYVSAETVQFTPESLFPTALGTDCITGPARATLTVSDSSGFLSTSLPTIIPENQNIVPEASIAVSTAPTCGALFTGQVTVTAENIFSQPVVGVPVIAFSSGGVTMTSSTEALTDATGQATFINNCPTAGTIEFTSGTLPPLFASVP